MDLGELVAGTRRRPEPPSWGLPLATALAAAGGALALLRPRERLPAPLPVRASSYFSPEELDRARRFRRGQRVLGAIAGAAELGALVAVARGEIGPGRPGTRRRRLRRRPPSAARAAAGAAGLTALTTAAGLPAGAIARRRGVRVGLVTQGWGGWAADLAKASLLRETAAAGAGATVVALRRRFGDGWWAPAAAAGTAAASALALGAPLFLEPLFNRFEPLEPGELRDDVLELARRAGVPARQVLVADASRRTTGYNAYVSGLGATRRVVLFDTLLGRDGADGAPGPAEVRMVVAHELAHVRHRDVPRLLAYGALVAAPAARAIDRIGRRLVPGAAADAPAALAGLLLAATGVSGLLGVPAGALSRAVERRADAFSMRLTGDPAALIAFHRRIVSRNVADPDPRGPLTRLLASHPPTVERLGLAEAFAARGA